MRNSGQERERIYPNDITVEVTVDISRAIHTASVAQQDTLVTGASGNILKSFLDMSLNAVERSWEDGRQVMRR
jgi:hypothetical protein